jgi:hypothetical protein
MDTDSDSRVGVSGFTAGDASLASILDLASLVGAASEGLTEIALRSDVFRDAPELELAFSDMLCDTFFSTNRLFPVRVAPGRFCLALEDAVLPSKGLEVTVLPGNCSALGLW